MEDYKKQVCSRCKRVAKEDEHFSLDFDAPIMFGLERYCDECKAELRKERKENQIKRYVSGEEEPMDTSEIVCPYCGYEHEDSWEYTEDYDKIPCEDCGKEFKYSREVEVTYSSSRIED